MQNAVYIRQMLTDLSRRFDLTLGGRVFFSIF